MQINAHKAPTKALMLPIFHTGKVSSMRASVACRIRKDRQAQDESAPVYLQIIINSSRTTIPLKVSWPVEYFDNRAGVFLPRSKNDQLSTDYNMMVQKEIGKVNEIFMFYRHSDFELSVPQFIKEYSRYGLKKNFLAWAEQENEDRFDAQKIELQTYKNTKSQINKIKSWKEEIRFAELDATLMDNLHAWLRKNQGLNNNSAWSILKTVKSMAARAAEQGIAVNLASIQSYKLPSTSGRIIYLTPAEIQKLWRYYHSDNIVQNHHQILQQFLFSTVTGLRFSDIERVTWKNIQDDFLVFEPWKTRALSKKVEVYLIPEAFELIDSKKGKLFETMTQPATNRILKDIAINCEIRKNLTTHVARHTFATEFLRRGGHIEVLQQALGHTKITTTMIYAHVDRSRLREQLHLMAGIGKAEPYQSATDR
jgi:integrase